MKKKNNLLKLFAAGLLALAVLAAVTALFPSFVHPNSDSAEKLYAALDDELLELPETNARLAASSNPYDYKKLVSYQSIIEEGPSILPELMNRLEALEENGLEAYLTALAIEEIGHFELRELGYPFASGKEWLQSYDSLVKTMPETVDSLTEARVSDSDMKKELKAYGWIALPYIKNDALRKELQSQLSDATRGTGSESSDYSAIQKITANRG